MKTTDLTYASTINVDQIRIDILEGMLSNMYNQIDKIRKEILLVMTELIRRNNHEHQQQKNYILV